MKIGSQVTRKSQIETNKTYLVITFDPTAKVIQPSPIILKGAVVLSTYYNPNRTWGLEENVYIFNVTTTYVPKHPNIPSTLKSLHRVLQTMYKDFPQILILWGYEYNNTFKEDDPVEDHIIVVCDSPEPKYHFDDLFHIDGAFSIEIFERKPKYNWWPYPEKPRVGFINIINHLINYHLPDEYKEKTRRALQKVAIRTKNPKDSGGNTDTPSSTQGEN